MPSPGTIIIGAIVIGALIFAAYRSYKNRKGCSCGCSGAEGSGGCCGCSSAPHDGDSPK